MNESGVMGEVFNFDDGQNEVPTDTLIKYAAGTFGWKTLPPTQVRAMAIEILQRRHEERMMYERYKARSSRHLVQQGSKT